MLGIIGFLICSSCCLAVVMSGYVGEFYEEDSDLHVFSLYEVQEN